MACNCELCVRNRGISEEIERLPEANREYFRVLLDGLLETEADLDYYKAIVDGSWPDSDEIIARKRNKANETID